MKLLRFGTEGEERPGILDDQGQVRSLEGIVPDITGQVITDEGLQSLRGVDINSLPLVDASVRLGCCINGVGKLICIGKNYADHAAETGMDVPSEPVVFMKATSSMCGPNDEVIIPRGSEKTDWEVELGVVIGKHGKYISEEEALDHVAGYCVINDVSERDFQFKHEGQWVKGKSADHFAPTGPYLVTRDEIADPQNLSLWLEVDGHRFQNSSTAKMVYQVPFLISYLSRFMSLHPGDIISTGTPDGVGAGQKPPLFLKPGQSIRLSVEGLGEQQQQVVADN